MNNVPARLHLLSLLLVASFSLPAAGLAQAPEKEPLKVGWIGPMTGPTVKYGAYQAAVIAEEDVNKEGGVGGRPLKLIFQDGKASGREATSAANYLINVEKVRYIVGGHCTPESLPISSIAERNKVLMLAAITSSPKLTPAGDYIFRVTAVNTQGLDKLLPYLRSQAGGKRFGVIYEETDYAEGMAEYFRDHAAEHGLTTVTYDGYAPGEQDFRGIVARLKRSGLDGAFLSVQAPDAAVLIVQRMAELGIKLRLTSNELAGNAIKANPGTAEYFEGTVFAEPRFEENSPRVLALKQRFREHFGLSELPYGMWTAEAYDAVRLIAATIGRCGDDVEKVKACLYETHAYPGLSGPIGFDKNGDGTREYLLKTVRGGEIMALENSR